MSMAGANPVLAPIRRWVLYSRANLTITVVGTFAALFAIGAVVGEDPSPTTVTTQESSISVADRSSSIERLTYDLDEVSESLVAAKSTAWASTKAPATAMAYAHAFVDTNPSDAMWAATIARYTAAEPGTNFLSARPRTPVVITGSTVSTLNDGPDGTRVARVSVPTQAGTLQISLRADDEGGQRWVVATPLPTLELTELDKMAAAVTPSPTPPSYSAKPTPTTTAPTPTSSPAPRPTFDLDEPTSDSELPALPSAATVPVPVPVPGPIPIPELDTPIPGER